MESATNDSPKPAASALLQALYQAPDNPSVTVAARALATHVTTTGLRSLAVDGITEDLVRASRSKLAPERERAMIALEEICRTVGSPGGFDPYILPLLPVILERYSETGKAEVIGKAAEKTVKQILKLPPPEAVPMFMSTLFEILSTSGVKWKTKTGALDILTALVKIGPDQIAERLGEIIPHLTAEMRDTKAEVSAAGQKAALAICGVLSNLDVLPFVPLLVNCMARPDTVPDAIKQLSANVWVRDVDGPTLAVLVPLLQRALSDRSSVVQRQTVILVGNLFKLVRSPDLAHDHLKNLFPGVHRIAETASFPEVREFALQAVNTLTISAGADEETIANLKKTGLGSTGPSPNSSIPGTPAIKLVDEDQILAEKSLILLIKKFANEDTDSFMRTSLTYQATCIASLVRKRDFDEAQWTKYTVPYLSRFIPAATAEQIAKENLKRWLEIDKERYFKAAGDDDDDPTEKIVDLTFSLAYGGLLLLNHTMLKLRRGWRYGVCGANGCGKSTLLKAINRHQIENFPEDVSTFYVEHDIDGEDSEANCLSFLVADKFVKAKNLTKEQISERMKEFGFDSARQEAKVDSLSGGWKMRLALARAMLCEADLLLLDEPTNHLDRASIEWLQDYLKAQTRVTILTVSHDSGFLDSICTDIIHYQNKQLVYYRGNLSKFVEKYPAAKSYYTLSASLVKFVFPPPGALMGVRSQTRAILKATNVTFTYPGAPKPSLMNASCAVTLSSRVGVVGPNGAGKSTLIKLLTGETVPDSGKIEKHPNLRVAYVAQHAFHNIGAHMEKTAVQYIAWRYQDGHDREQAMKASRVLTEEEKRQMEVPIEGKNGEKRKLEMIIGRQKLKKSFQYECKWKNMDHKHNSWLPREKLIEAGFSKLVQEHDDLEASREGSGTRDLSFKVIRSHLIDVGLDGDIAEYNELKGLSGGQKVKVVIAAALWSKPQVLILDEPTNFLDRDALGGLAVAIRDWAGAFVCISHNEEFVGALCPEIWNVEGGKLIHKGKAAVVEGDAFEDGKRTLGNGLNSKKGTPSGSKSATPLASATPSATNSGNEGEAADPNAMPVVKKKKLTRKQLKDREERRRMRKLRWLSDSTGAPREPDTDTGKFLVVILFM
ncbi:P-loop containing nucleoside triphosphate hydrolase protein [Melampsora americana]|nr:P-loop containing nucleoside triphosphate hydrolase protein [Melampsora americana]